MAKAGVLPSDSEETPSTADIPGISRTSNSSSDTSNSSGVKTERTPATAGISGSSWTSKNSSDANNNRGVRTSVVEP